MFILTFLFKCAIIFTYLFIFFAIVTFSLLIQVVIEVSLKVCCGNVESATQNVTEASSLLKLLSKTF